MRYVKQLLTLIKQYIFEIFTSFEIFKAIATVFGKIDLRLLKMSITHLKSLHLTDCVLVYFFIIIILCNPCRFPIRRLMQMNPKFCSIRFWDMTNSMKIMATSVTSDIVLQLRYFTYNSLCNCIVGFLVEF